MVAILPEICNNLSIHPGVSSAGFSHRNLSDMCLLMSVAVFRWLAGGNSRFMLLKGLKFSNGIVLVDPAPLACTG